jgi:organic radical activating enzyme
MIHVHEIFTSISGEVGLFPQGTWCLFLRLQGCNLRCAWCDTRRAQSVAEKIGQWQEEGALVEHLAAMLRPFHSPRLLVTGGEPLLQEKALIAVLQALHAELPQVKVQVETNGTLLPSQELQEQVDCFVFDFKPPSSGVPRGMLLREEEWRHVETRWLGIVKVIVASEEDLRCAVGLAAVFGGLRIFVSATPEFGHGRLIQELSRSGKGPLFGLHVNVQLHKLLGLTENPHGNGGVCYDKA